jgi:predicted ATPase
VPVVNKVRSIEEYLLKLSCQPGLNLLKIQTPIRVPVASEVVGKSRLKTQMMAQKKVQEAKVTENALDETQSRLCSLSQLIA